MVADPDIPDGLRDLFAIGNSYFDLPQLVQDDRVAEMDVRGRRIEPELDPKRHALGEGLRELARKLAFHEQLVGTVAEDLELALDSARRHFAGASRIATMRCAAGRA